MTILSSPILQSFLSQKTRSSDRPVAVFDCDGTVIQGDIGEEMFYYQIEHFLFRTSPASVWPRHPQREELGELFDALAALPHAERTEDPRFADFADLLVAWYFDQLAANQTADACADIVRLLAGFTHSELQAIASATLHAALDREPGTGILGTTSLHRGVRFFQEPAELIRHLHAAGWDIVAVSGSNQWSVVEVFRTLGIPGDRVIGIDLIEQEGMLTHEVCTPIPILEGKVEALEARALPRPLIVGGDSIYDLPLFEHGEGLKVLINSGSGSPAEFFTSTGFTRDSSWLVVDRPTRLMHP